MLSINRNYNGWVSFTNEAFPSESCTDKYGRSWIYDRFKLHISIDANHLNLVFDEIHALLYKAATEGIITSFKEVDIPSAKAFVARGGSFGRGNCMPFVLYLHNLFSKTPIDRLLSLINTIETLLEKKKIPIGTGTVSIADIKLTEHVSFRQTALDKLEYIDSSDTEQTPKLREAGLESDYYKALQKDLSNTAKPSPLEEAKEETPKTAEEKTSVASLLLDFITASKSNDGKTEPTGTFEVDKKPYFA